MAGELTRWDPFREVFTLRDAMDRLFEDSVVWPRSYLSRDTSQALATLPLDMYETPDHIIVKTILPGLTAEEVNIQFQDGHLIINAALPAPKIENATFHYRELAYGQYHREIALPMPVETDKVEATLQNGVLTLSIPKAGEIKPKKIQIKTAAK